MKIIERSKDPGGNWVVRVLVTSIYSNFFFYDHDPLDSEVEQTVYNYCLAMSDAEYDVIKSPFLKMVENLYYGFIKVEWNATLKSHGIIPSDYEVTIANTDEMKNIEYLLALRSMNRQEYYNMAGEFDRYKRLINDNDGIMSRVKFHADI